MKKNLLLKTLAITLLLIGSTVTFVLAQGPKPDSSCNSSSYLIFNGDSSQYLQFPPNTENIGNFLNSLDTIATIECDVYLTKDTANEYIFSASGVNGGNPYYVGLTPDDSATGTPQFVITTSGFSDTVTAPNPLDTGVWHHIAVVYNSALNHGTYALYIDGDSVASDTGANLQFDYLSSISAMYAGKSVQNSADPYLYGYLDEFRVSDTDRYSGPSYTVLATEFTSDSYTVALYHFDDGFAGASQTAADASGNNFTAILGANDTDSTYDPTWAQCMEVTPVDLSDFTGQAVKGGIQLIWNTASEQNSNYFSVERSEDGNTFQEIGSVKAAGTTSANHSYLYNDLDPLPGMNYYRLKQVDLDGSFIYSRVIGINYLANAAAFKVYPTLTTGNINVTLPSPGQVIIVNMMGSEVQRVNVTNTNQQINVSNLPAGQYILKVVGTNNSTMFIKQ